MEDDYEQQGEKQEESQECVKEEGDQEMEKQPDNAENVSASEVAMEAGDTKSDVPLAGAKEDVQERAEVEPDQQESAPRDNGQAERMEASEERPGQCIHFPFITFLVAFQFGIVFVQGCCTMAWCATVF